METVHIHHVIFLIEQNQGQPYTHATLQEAIAQTWGRDVHFVACSGVPFPANEALPFLLSRNKVVVDGQGQIALHPSMSICNGHEAHDSQHDHQH